MICTTTVLLSFALLSSAVVKYHTLKLLQLVDIQVHIYRLELFGRNRGLHCNFKMENFLQIENIISKYLRSILLFNIMYCIFIQMNWCQLRLTHKNNGSIHHRLHSFPLIRPILAQAFGHIPFETPGPFYLWACQQLKVDMN